MTKTTSRVARTIKLSPLLGLPEDKVEHFRCGHKKSETGVWVSGYFRCHPCYRKAQRTYQRYKLELERTT